MKILNAHHVALFLDNRQNNFNELEKSMPSDISPTLPVRSLYTRDSVRKIISFLRELAQQPKTRIKLGDNGKPDDLCKLCDNYNAKNNFCRANPFSYEELRDEDERILKELKLPSIEFSVQELIDYR